MQGKSEAIAAKGIGQDDVGAGVDESTMHLLDNVGLLDIEQFRTAPALEAEGEESRAHGAIGN